MLATCAFRHEQGSEQNLVELDAGSVSVRVCPRCLVLIVVHRRIHDMKVEKLIPEMAE